ncbi:MAG: hypothetical protein WB580_16480 [Candidatus Binataceae bacterium]
MLESLRQNWKLAVSLFSSVVAAAVIVCLLIDWRNSTATLSALFGALVGWALGILLAPYEDEEKRFAQMSKAVFGFIAGFGAGKFDRILDLMRSMRGGSLGGKEGSNMDLLLGACCFLLATITVFVFRTYSTVEENTDGR